MRDIGSVKDNFHGLEQIQGGGRWPVHTRDVDGNVAVRVGAV